MWPLTPMMEKLYVFKKTKTNRIYMEALSLHNGATIVHWEDNKSFVSVVQSKIFTPRFKHIDIPVYFILENFDNGILFQNMRSLVSSRQICAPNHDQVQLSAVVLNWRLGSYYIQPVIHDTINSLYYMSFLWTKLIIGCV